MPITKSDLTIGLFSSWQEDPIFPLDPSATSADQLQGEDKEMFDTAIAWLESYVYRNPHVTTTEALDAWCEMLEGSVRDRCSHA